MLYGAIIIALRKVQEDAVHRLRSYFTLFDFSELDQQIEKMRELRDSYRAANIAHFGEELAALLND